MYANNYYENHLNYDEQETNKTDMKKHNFTWITTTKAILREKKHLYSGKPCENL